MNITEEDKEVKTIRLAKKGKQLTSIYLNVELIESIDDFIYFAKKELPLNKRKKLNRSAFIQLILSEVIEDHSRCKDESFLWKLILASNNF